MPARTAVIPQSRNRSTTRAATASTVKDRVLAVGGIVIIGVIAGLVVYNLVLPQISGDHFRDQYSLIGGRVKFHPYAGNPMLWVIAGLSFACVFAGLAWLVLMVQTVLGTWRKVPR